MVEDLKDPALVQWKGLSASTPDTEKARFSAWTVTHISVTSAAREL